MQESIKIIPSHLIDESKWNDCLLVNKGLIYSRYEYLNAMSKHWVGLVLGDYKGIMPICFKKKFGIQYSFIPPFIQQLNWVGKPVSTLDLKHIILQFTKYGDLMWNRMDKGFNQLPKINFIIDLNNSYEKIYNNYSTDLKQNLKKAAKEKLNYKGSSTLLQAINIYKKLYANRLEKTTQQDFDHFINLCLQLFNNNQCFVREVLNSNNEIMAIALLLKDENRIYNIANTTTELGRKTEANHFLLDNIIKEFSSKDLIFDFEGSDIDGVKKFYQKFGPINEPYYHWHINEHWLLPKGF